MDGCDADSVAVEYCFGGDGLGAGRCCSGCCYSGSEVSGKDVNVSVISGDEASCDATGRSCCTDVC